MPDIERGHCASHAIQVAKPSAEHSAGMSLETGYLATQSDGGVMFVGRCRDFCGAWDQKIGRTRPEPSAAPTGGFVSKRD